MSNNTWGTYRFIPDYPIDKPQPAQYNPRYLSPDRAARLQESIKTLGVIRPIIVTESGLIIAGHQRTRNIKACGFTTVPAVVIGDAGLVDEIRFNMIHNAADKEETDGTLSVPPCSQNQSGWAIVQHDQIQELVAPTSGVRRHAIMELMQIHGCWGAVVATYSGAVIACQLYASAAKVLRTQLLVYYVPDGRADLVREYFSEDYGQFSYANLPDTPWTQTLAQKMRLRVLTEGSRKPQVSHLYTERVLPILQPTTRLLDFGAGQMDHANALRRKGHPVFPVEFFFRKKTAMQIDTEAVHRHIDEMLDEMLKNGRFDMTIADSVLNSVTSLQAEADVLACLNIFCKPGGMILWSTRPLAAALENMDGARIQSAGAACLRFFDNDGFTSTFTKGVWLTQKHHTREQVAELTAKWIGTKQYPGASTSTYTMAAIKGFDLPDDVAEGAIRREFDLKWPNNQTVGRADKAIAVWREVIARERAAKTKV